MWVKLHMCSYFHITQIFMSQMFMWLIFIGQTTEEISSPIKIYLSTLQPTFNPWRTITTQSQLTCYWHENHFIGSWHNIVKCIFFLINHPWNEASHVDGVPILPCYIISSHTRICWKCWCLQQNVYFIATLFRAAKEYM